VVFSPILEFLCYILVLSLCLFLFYSPVISYILVVVGLSDFPHQKKEVDIVKVLKNGGWYCATSMSYSSAMKFDGRINFSLWKVQVKDVLIQLGLHKALKENTSNMEADK